MLGKIENWYVMTSDNVTNDKYSIENVCPLESKSSFTVVTFNTIFNDNVTSRVGSSLFRSLLFCSKSLKLKSDCEQFALVPH